MAHAAERAKQVEVRGRSNQGQAEWQRLDQTGRGQVDPLTVSICGPDPAFSTDSAGRRRLSISAASSPSAEGSLSATFAARSAHAEGVHPRLAIQ